ncbi:MAG: hypothetical protein ACLR3S_10935 [Clostridium fessum]
MCRRLFQDGYPDSIVQETIGFCRNIILWTMPDMRRITAGSWKAEKPGGIEALPAAKRHIARDHPGAAGRDRT